MKTAPTILLSIFLFTSISLFSQTTSKWSAQLLAGVGLYEASSDFYIKRYTKNNQPFINFEANGINTSSLMSFVATNLTYSMNDRWALQPFVSFQHDKGDAFKDEITTFGPTSQNPEIKTYSWPAPRTLKVFTMGIHLLYKFKARNKFRSYFGAGVAFMHRTHDYRRVLEVDFSDDYDVSGIKEEYVHNRKNVLGSIPITTGFDREINDHLSLGLNVSGQLFPKLGDYQLNASVGATYHW